MVTSSLISANRWGKPVWSSNHHPKRTAFKAQFTDLRTPYGCCKSPRFSPSTCAPSAWSRHRDWSPRSCRIKVDMASCSSNAADSRRSRARSLLSARQQSLIARIEPRCCVKIWEFNNTSVRGDKRGHRLAERQQDVIPQMAEFCLQIEGVDWGIGGRGWSKTVVISARRPREKATL